MLIVQREADPPQAHGAEDACTESHSGPQSVSSVGPIKCFLYSRQGRTADAVHTNGHVHALASIVRVPAEHARQACCQQLPRAPFR